MGRKGRYHVQTSKIITDGCEAGLGYEEKNDIVLVAVTRGDTTWAAPVPPREARAMARDLLKLAEQSEEAFKKRSQE